MKNNRINLQKSSYFSYPYNNEKICFSRITHNNLAKYVEPSIGHSVLISHIINHENMKSLRISYEDI